MKYLYESKAAGEYRCVSLQITFLAQLQIKTRRVFFFFFFYLLDTLTPADLHSDVIIGDDGL